MPRGVELVVSEVDVIEPHDNRVLLKKEGRVLAYDSLIVTTGHASCRRNPWPDRREWRKSIFDFYTSTARHPPQRLRTWQERPPGAQRRRDAHQMPGCTAGVPLPGRLVFPRPGLRDKVELTYATPLDGRRSPSHVQQGCFATCLKRKTSGSMTEFTIVEVDADGRKIRVLRRPEIPYDLLVTIPLNMGRAGHRRFRARQRAQFVPTAAKHALTASNYDDIPSSSATPPICRARRQGRSRTFRATCLPKTSCAASTDCRSMMDL